ncbi:MAG: hypothetical protein Q8N14_01225 [Candidatus Omnitrophota bacterium]|nr:hypothetical protein [Candidatus Omnitrophota bacterium]
MFNQQARWDRNLPQQDSNNLNEPIRVVAEFEKSKVLPRYFFWRKKLFRIKKVTYFWQERQGRELLNFFSVETPVGLYQISFNNQSFSWSLNKII